MANYLLINSVRYLTPFECLNWENAPRLVKRHTKVTPRKTPVQIVMAHTVHGKKCTRLLPGAKASTRDLTWARSHWNSKRKASTDGYIDTDGSMVWANDPWSHYTWGCGGPNRYCVQVELVTDDNGQMYQATIDTFVEFVRIVCPVFGIQVQTPWDLETDTPYAGRVPRLDPGRAGADLVGIFGHRNVWTHPKKLGPDGKLVTDTSRVTASRGFGDPNDFPFLGIVEKLHAEKFSFRPTQGQAPDDLRVWAERQSRLNVQGERDGVPREKTRAALLANGCAEGLYVF